MPGERSVLRDRNFVLYFSGVVLSEIGVRGTLAINLYHVFLLTGSTVLVGTVGLFQAVAGLAAGPLGGALADRLDRRRMIQVMQSVSLLVSAGLAAVTFLGVVQPWHIYLSVSLNTIATTFDSPARVALIPNIVPRHQLGKAFALVNPGREVAWLAGPAIGGVLVSIGGPGLMYAADAGTYLALIAVLALLRVSTAAAPTPEQGILAGIREGFAFVRGRSIIWQLLALDLVSMLFGAWRVVLPALAEDILQIGATGYGLLSAVVPAGALFGSAVIYRTINRWPSGYVVLGATAAYGFACIALVQAPWLSAVFVAGFAIGSFDAMWSTVQQTAIQLETPDEIRGRVSSLHLVIARGGPNLGNANVGLIAGALGPVGALTVGGLVPVAAASLVAAFGRNLRRYRAPNKAG